MEKTKIRLLYSLSLLLLSSALVNAQLIVGLWTVDNVSVGDENMTPVAKWFEQLDDNTYKAGNGWLQNDKGTYTYNEKTNEFSPESWNGKDEFGPFKVIFSEGKMKWERMEEGMKVVVTLSPALDIPMSPKDSIVGNWNLFSVVKDGEDITSTYDTDNKESFFIQWTSTYRKTNPDGSRSNGYWHMDPHRPEFHLIDYNREVAVEVFEVSFKDDMVLMKPKSDSVMVFTYKKN